MFFYTYKDNKCHLTTNTVYTEKPEFTFHFNMNKLKVDRGANQDALVFDKIDQLVTPAVYSSEGNEGSLCLCKFPTPNGQPPRVLGTINATEITVTAIVVDEHDNIWGQTTHNKQSGWVCLNLLKPVKSDSSDTTEDPESEPNPGPESDPETTTPESESPTPEGE